MKSQFGLLLLVPVTLLGLSTRAEVTIKVPDQLDTLASGSVRMEGLLGEALETSVEGRLTHADVEEMLTPFRERKDVHEWRSEFWGKWMTAAIPAWRSTDHPELHSAIKHAVSGLLTTQTADGYIGAFPDEGRLQRWDMWGRKYTLLGLLAWHQATGDAVALAAARRQADLVLLEVGPGKASPFTNDMWHGMASGSILEPMVLLYRVTGDQRYLDFAKYLVKSWASPEGPDLLNKAIARTPVYDMFAKPKGDLGKTYRDHGQSKAYEMMSNFEGLTELYRITGETRLIEAVRWVHQNILDTEITVIGSGSDWERWYNGKYRQTETWAKGMETCVTVTWIKFSAQLLRLTGEPSFADEIERAAYNALLGAQARDGQWWCHHTPLSGIKERAPDQCGMHQNCCVASGPRGLVVLPQIAVMNRREGPLVNLYGTMRATVPLADGGKVALSQASDYPRTGEIEITVTPDAARHFSLALRIPAWSEHTQVSINGEPLHQVRPGRYLELKRRWNPGDIVRLTLDLSIRVLEAPGDNSHIALVRGPVILARDERLSPKKVDEAINLNEGGSVTAVAVAPHDGISQTFAVNRTDFLMCDFASAGNTWSDTSRYRVWLPRLRKPR